MLKKSILFLFSPTQEEKLNEKYGYEQLNEPLLFFIDAEFPEDIIESHLGHADAVALNF